MKIVTIVGARPQFVKAAAVSRPLRARDGVKEVLVHTGQHFDAEMSEVFFSEMEIPEPDYNLEIAGLSHGAMTGRMLERIEDVLLSERPDLVMVYGDTNSTLAGALAAAKLHIPVAHIEAGLRSFNRRMPEEVNRVLTDHVSVLLFAPTDTAVDNLANENVTEGVHNVGDVMYDAVLHYSGKAEEKSRIMHRLELQEKQFVLATVHRAENTDDPERVKAIFEQLDIVTSNGTEVIMPLHPRTMNRMRALGIKTNVGLIEPVGYFDMLQLERNAKTIVTDSGGVQKEAYFHGVPCITVRDETEWTELVDSGWNVLSEPALLGDAVQRAVSDVRNLSTTPFYGDGHAAEKIIELLLSP